MDLTKEFEALTSTRITPVVKNYNALDSATALVAKIMKFKKYLTKYGHHYLNIYEMLPGACIMNDEVRNKLDRDVEAFIKQCRETMKVLQSEIRLNTTSNQVIEHRVAVIEMVMIILNDFVNYYTQLRTTRLQRVTEKQNMSRLTVPSLPSSNLVKHSPPRNCSSNLDDFVEQDIAPVDITQQELLLFAHENNIMQEELMTLKDEVNSIQKKVHQISKLQELFREKVQEQEIELNELHETAIKSSENVKDGNDMIIEVIMKNASTRVFLLSYIITLAFTLLFLDWYNP